MWRSGSRYASRAAAGLSFRGSKVNRVTVAILTYKRPDDLHEALPQLVAAIEEHPGAEILVVDNDVVPSAETAVTSLQEPRIRYVHEPSPGIASARNRAIDETHDRDVLIFIDDDERPASGWLQNLLGVQQKSGAEAVAGPVLSEYGGELDPWIVAGGYFRHPRWSTGTEIGVAATNNLLLLRDFVVEHGLRFDEEFGLSGGSDSVFTRQLVRAGGRIVWCDEAVVIDVIPDSRATRNWVRRRAFRLGNTEARARIHVARPGGERLKERIVCLGKGLARVAGGAAKVGLGGLTRSVQTEARGTRTALRGAGMLLAGFGYRYFEYRRTPARQ